MPHARAGVPGARAALAGGPNCQCRKPNAQFRAQIHHEFERFGAYLPDINVMVIYGGVDIKAQKEALKSKPPHVVVGTPGRIKTARAPCVCSAGCGSPGGAPDAPPCAASLSDTSWPRTAS